MDYVNKPILIEEIIKKSRFIGILSPCLTENEALLQLNTLHQQHPNASHIAFSYRILSPQGIKTRINDAGEPSGTAGKPIYQHLEGKNLINIMIVVIRYFGGIKLGAGGLTRAYGNTAKKTIEACKLVKYIEFSEAKLKIEYPQLQNFEYQLKKLNGIIINQDFSENILLHVKLPEKNITLLANQFALDDI